MNDQTSVEAIFWHVLHAPDSQTQAARLDAACGGNESLRLRVERLLAAHLKVGVFLEQAAALRADEVSPVDATEECTTDGSVTPVAFPDSCHFPPDLLAEPTTPGTMGRLGPYDVVRLIGRGGMGAVFEAHDPLLNRTVALKVLLGAMATEETRECLLREARAATVRHDNIVVLHSVELNGPHPYLVMEFVPGMSLLDRLHECRPLELSEIVRIGRQTAAGLAAAHDRGLIHRDIKPATLLLDAEGQVKLTDFGLARELDGPQWTRLRAVAGTPLYMSPEQVRGEAVDTRTDLFSLGAVLYACCTGHSPFQADSTLAVLRRVCDAEPPPIRDRNPAIPEWFCDVVNKLLAKNPANRFADAASVATLLSQMERQMTQGQTPSRLPSPKPIRRWWLVLPGITLMLLGLGVTEWTGVTGLVQSVTTWWQRAEQQTETPNPSPVLPDARELARRPNPLDAWQRQFPPTFLKLLSDKKPEILAPELLGVCGWREPPRPVTAADYSEAEHTAAVAFSPDGAILAVAKPSGVELYDLVDQGRKLVAEGLICHASAISFSPNGAWLAIGMHDGTIRLWDCEARRRVWNRRWHTVHVTAVAFSPDNQHLYSSAFDGAVQVQDVAGGRLRHTLLAEERGMKVVAISPDGRRLAVGIQAGKIFLYDTTSFERLRTLLGHSDIIHSLRFHPNGKWLASTGMEDDIRLWDYEKGELWRHFKVDQGQGRSLRWRADGELLTSVGGEQGFARLTAPMGAQPSSRALRICDASVKWLHTTDLSPEGRYLAVGTPFGAVLIVRLAPPSKAK